MFKCLQFWRAFLISGIMSATIYSLARFGCAKDETGTGLALSSFSTNSEIDEAFALNHGGSTVGFSLYNDRASVEFAGVVAVKTTGLAINLGSVLTSANVTADSLNTTTAQLFTTSVANAGLIVRSGGLTRGNSAFEEGSLGCIYFPLLATNAPSTLAD